MVARPHRTPRPARAPRRAARTTPGRVAQGTQSGRPQPTAAPPHSGRCRLPRLGSRARGGGTLGQTPIGRLRRGRGTGPRARRFWR
eukprot:6098308-Lingulodinium_polyedra.AAC.1